MISPAEAAKKVLTTQKYDKVIFVKDYDQQHYVVEALPEDYEVGMQTTFGVDKNTGDVTAFFPQPGSTLEKYNNAKCLEF